MAWAEKRGDGYRAAWRDGDGTRRYKSGFRHKKTAVTFAVEQEQASQGVSLTDPRATFDDWLEKWLRIRNVEASTDKKDRERIDKHVRPQWGSVPVVKITKMAAEEWVSELDEVLSAWTVRRVWFNFATPLRWAHERGARLSNPIAYALSRGTLPAPSRGHERYLPWVMFPDLEGRLDGAGKMAAQLLFGTGTRFGEMAGLHRHRIDLDRQVMHVLETWDREGRRIKGYPKEGASRITRTVPLADWLCAALSDWFDANPDPGRCGFPHAGSDCRSGLIVVGVRGRPLNREHYAADVLKPALAEIGQTGFRIHDTRHTYASWLLQAGRSLVEVSELLGHHSIVVTQKYAHLDGTHWAGVRGALSRGDDAAPRTPRGQLGDTPATDGPLWPAVNSQNQSGTVIDFPQRSATISGKPRAG